MKETQSIKIFLSYSREDEALRDKLANHLKNLERKEVISAWHDSKIDAGAERDSEIEKHLNSAQIILLLVSADFIASDERWKLVERAMERHDAKEAHVIPVLLRPCDWENTIFGKLECLPKRGSFITKFENQDQAFTEVVDGIKNIVKKISGKWELQNSNGGSRWQIPWRSLLSICGSSIGVSILVVFIRFSGILEPSELWFFDRMMQSKPNEPQDHRILIIEITKDDIDNLDTQKGFRQGSLTDKTLLELMNKLQDPRHKPLAIGLDIHRDYETNTQELANILKENDTLIAVCNVGDKSQNNDGVKPPPEIINAQRLGFSDFLSDSNNIVRRQIITMELPTKSPCYSEKDPVKNSLSFQLARRYLEHKKMKYQEPSFIHEKMQYLQFDRVVFEPIDKFKSGGYSIFSDFNGYQLLLNYRRSCDKNNPTNCSPEYIAEKVTVKDVLKNNILEKINNMTDKIVLIGLNEVSYEAPWATPFSAGEKLAIPGVTIHAQMVSQILSAVLDKRPLLRVWSIKYEICWILAWSLVGAIMPLLCRSKRGLIIFGILAPIGLYLFCFFLFSKSKLWVPFVPAVLTLLGTGGTVVLIEFKTPQSS